MCNGTTKRPILSLRQFDSGGSSEQLLPKLFDKKTPEIKAIRSEDPLPRISSTIQSLVCKSSPRRLPIRKLRSYITNQDAADIPFKTFISKRNKMHLKPVFLLLVHADGAQAKRLLKQLMQVGTCFVHVDAKSDFSDFFIRDERITYLKERVDVRWGAISQVFATLRLMRAALAISQAAEVSHFVLLSGSCYPAQSLAEFSRFSSLNASKNLIKTISLKSSEKLNQRIQHMWFYEDIPATGQKIALSRLIRGVLQAGGKLARRKFPLYADYYFGSQWWALNHRAVSYLISHPAENKLTRFLRFSKAPDEIYFHTLMANSELRDTLQTVPGQGVWNASNLHLIDSSLARWFNAGDFDEIKNSKCWFVRKVDTLQGSALCDMLDRSAGNYP